MLVIDVLRNSDDGHYFATWYPVIGVLCVVETTYERDNDGSHRTPREVTHEEMRKAGWRPSTPGLKVYPVVASTSTEELGIIRVLGNGGNLDPSNLVYRLVVPCDWPIAEDEANVTRLGNEMVADEGCIGLSVRLNDPPKTD